MFTKQVARTCSCNECGCPTKKPKKGDKLDTQLFPGCKDTKYDRDIVKKEEKRKKKKSFNLKEYLKNGG